MIFVRQCTQVAPTVQGDHIAEVAEKWTVLCNPLYLCVYFLILADGKGQYKISSQLDECSSEPELYIPIILVIFTRVPVAGSRLTAIYALCSSADAMVTAMSMQCIYNNYNVS